MKESIENTSISDQPSENLIQQEFEYDAPLSAPHNEIQTPSLNTSTNTKILERNICSHVPEQAEHSVFEIHKIESAFALKLMAKHMLPQQVVTDILAFSGSIHAAKIEVVKSSLKIRFDNDNYKDICKEIDLIEKNSSLKDKLSTHHMRVQYLKKRFEYVEPRRIEIGTIRNKVSFCMDLPIAKTLTRLMSDESLRKFMINDPIFTSLQSVSFK